MQTWLGSTRTFEPTGKSSNGTGLSPVTWPCSWCPDATRRCGLKPEAAVPFLAATHKAFYAENRDVTDGQILQDLAADQGVDPDEFTRAFSSREMTYATSNDFYRSQAFGVRGFPTVFLRTGEKLALLCAGFRPFDDLKPHLDEWIAEKGEDEENPEEVAAGE